MLPFQTDAAQRKDGAHKCAKIQATECFACDFTEIPFHVDLFQDLRKTKCQILKCQNNERRYIYIFKVIHDKHYWRIYLFDNVGWERILAETFPEMNFPSKEWQSPNEIVPKRQMPDQASKQIQLDSK